MFQIKPSFAVFPLDPARKRRIWAVSKRGGCTKRIGVSSETKASPEPLAPKNKKLRLLPALQLQLSFRLPMPVTHVQSVRDNGCFNTLPICPRCKMTVCREYQRYCDNCGQNLNWESFQKAIIVMPKRP